MSEPIKEIVRTAPSPASSNTSLPSRIPAAPIRRVPPKLTPLPGISNPVAPTALGTISPVPQSIPKPPGPALDPAFGAEIAPLLPRRVEATASRDSVLGQVGPKKETARLAIHPKSPLSPSPAPNSTQTSPSPVHPIITSGSIPRSISWVVFGLAALIFLIQILNYVVS
jgi:hypothetical protein